MDVHSARNGERLLRRVIALLVAFAHLAERAAGRSAPVRWFVLWISRRAETVAEEYFYAWAGMPPPAVEGFAAEGNGPEDALRLAGRFLAMAAALLAFLPDGRRPGARRLALRGLAFDDRERGGRHPGGWTRRPYDTS